MKKSFTLIELLIVISIIAILAAILMPALNQARSKARQAGCLNNIKQMNLVFAGYHQDNGDWVMPTYAAASDGKQKWYYRMEPYIADFRKMVCPMNLLNGRAYFNYGLNLYNGGVPGNSQRRWKVNQIKRPSCYLYVGEATSAGTYMNYYVSDNRWWIARPHGNAEASFGAFDGKTNIGFADGHARLVDYFHSSNQFGVDVVFWPLN